MSTTFEDNSKKVLEELDKTINRALYYAGVKIIEETTKHMTEIDFTGRDIVDTGRLRASISFITPDRQYSTSELNHRDVLIGKADKYTLMWGSNVEYASFVNNGTSRQPARQFIERGYERAKQQVIDGMTKIIKGEL